MIKTGKDTIAKNIQNAQKTLDEARRLFEKNKIENALKEVNKSIEFNETIEAYLLRVKVYRALGKFTLALRDCRQISQMEGYTNQKKIELAELIGD
ncbi:MAG: hypothetical protein AB7F64_05070, partial [Gammaproteobacteria bacterium]